MWYISTMEYDSSIKRNELLIHATTWVSLADMTLREVSQTQEDKFIFFHLNEVPGTGKFRGRK